MAADTDNPQAERFAANAAALEEVQPEWIEASDIDVVLCQDLVQVKMRNFSPF